MYSLICSLTFILRISVNAEKEKKKHRILLERMQKKGAFSKKGSLKK